MNSQLENNKWNPLGMNRLKYSGFHDKLFVITLILFRLSL